MTTETRNQPAADLDPGTVRELDRQFALLNHPRSWQPLVRTVEGVSVVDLGMPDSLNLPPHRRILVMIFLLAIKDRASEIHFEPVLGDDGARTVRLLYQVDSKLLDLVPPPTEITHLIMREVEALAGCRQFRHRVATRLRRLACRIDGQKPGWESGQFRLQLGVTLLAVALHTYPSELGNRLFVHLPPIAVADSDEAGRQLKVVFESHQARCTPTATVPT